MAVVQDPRTNQLLAALPDDEWQRWQHRLEAVEMPLGQVLYESGHTLSHAYFPTTAIVSLLYVMENGASAEIAVAGNEGLVGISLFMGGGSTPSRAVVQSAGLGFRMPAQAIKDEFERSGAVVQRAAALHAGADHADGADGGVQPPPHAGPATVPLAAAEPGPPAGHELLMTQELIANMLGVRREGVTEAATRLAEGRADPLRAGPHHGAGPRGAGEAQLRVLRGRQEGIRPAAAQQVGRCFVGRLMA